MRHHPLFCQTVTLYHPDPETRTVARRVLHGVNLQAGRREQPDPAGTRGGTMALVVIPAESGRFGVDYTLAPGDRICPGEGPELNWQQWLCFLPAAGDVVAVSYVTPYLRADKPHHVEAGGWWSSRGTGARRLTS